MKATKKKEVKRTRAPKVPVKQPHQWTYDGTEVLILKRIPKTRETKNGFKWPNAGPEIVVCPDWNPAQACGGGLHGWPWGFGIGDGMDFDIIEDIWLILAAKPEDVIGELEHGWKCKARQVIIRFEGGFREAMAQLLEGRAACIEQMANAASGDDSNLAASGDDSNLAASGDDSNLAASGYASNLAASGYASKLAASGYDSKLAASGDASKLAASGDASKLAASGYDSVCACAAEGGRIMVGERGAFAIAYWDQKEGWEFAIGKVGVNGVKSKTWYHVEDGKLVEG